LLRIKGPSVALAELTERPCVGLALFTRDEWSALKRRGLSAREIRPEMAGVRVSLYPAFGNAAAVIRDPAWSAADAGGLPSGVAWVALGAPRLKGTSIPVEWETGMSLRCDPAQ
jgi:hypothetical protein